jgi:hypothetical protein
MQCLAIDERIYCISRGVANTAHLEDDLYEDVPDPNAVIAALHNSPVNADIFTFCQRVPDTEPQFSYSHEPEGVAVLRVTTFDHWIHTQVKPTARNKIRKAHKAGVEVREVRFDDDFVHGMTEIFNETPIRQGRTFWHYGKDFATVKEQFSRYLFREDLLGAYYHGELIGFVMLGDAGRYGVLGQIISKIQHRDKAPNNALIAKAVAICERKQLPYLVYAKWGDGSLIDFKRANGFEEIRLPRYYVPITWKGEMAVRLGLHRGWKTLLPANIKNPMKALRSRWLRLVANA